MPHSPSKVPKPLVPSFKGYALRSKGLLKEVEPSKRGLVLDPALFMQVGRKLNLSKALLTQGKTQGSTLQQRTNKTLTTGAFRNTCKADEVSPEVEAGGVAGLKCLKPSWDTDM
jgi:hypothetical protein